MNSDYVSEIYSSVQGEGPYTGERQVFLRLAGCPLRCDYCDTPASLTAQGHPRLSVKEVVDKVLAEASDHQIKTVSITGGEPLAHVSFLKNVLPLLRVKGLRLYLETAGIHADALSEIVEHLDVISMDIKLPSSTGKSFWDEHREFLKLGGRKIFVKVVIESRSRLSELEKAIDLLAKNSKKSLLVLQPVTPIKGQVEGANPDIIAEAFALASRKLPRVLVLPQQHKLWGVR
jgi:organic radical activating enzyme